MRGEKWGATKLINMVRSLQPQVIIDNVWKPVEREEDPCMSVIRHRTMAIS